MTIELSTLANGLRIATDRIDTVDTVSLGIWVDVGTRHEPAEINGVAHFLEHMAFKGTERRSALAIAEEIEAVGGHLNAYTSRESTAYYAKVLKDDVPLALDILADILQHSTFEPEELERERAVILQEIGQANDTPDDIIFDHFQECAYPEQAMGRPVLGRPEIIRRLGRGEVMAYLRDHYGARRMVLAAAGNLDHDRIAGLAGRLLGELPADRSVTTEPARYAGGDRREERDLEQLHLVLGFPGLALEDPDYLRRLGAGDGVRRRHVLAAVSGDPRAARVSSIRSTRLPTATATAASSGSMPGPVRTRRPSWCRPCAKRRESSKTV